MEAKIIDISSNGDNGIIVRVVISDNAETLNFNNVMFNGQPCLELNFNIPVGERDYITVLQNNIVSTIQSKLRDQVILRSAKNSTVNVVDQLRTNLLNNVTSADKVEIGDVEVHIDGSVTDKVI
jgi:hypothetical protein